MSGDPRDEPARRHPARAERDWVDEVLIQPHESALTNLSREHDELAPVGVAPVRVAPAWLVVTALLLACAAVISAAAWWQHRSRVIEVTRRTPHFYPAGPDATGCPIGLRCAVLADVGQPLNVLARRLFPDATVLSSLSVTSAATGRTVQTTVVLRTPSGVEVSAIAQCVPGGAPIPSRLAPLSVTGPAQADIVVAGAPGCSVAVAAQIPRSEPVPLARLRQLAGDPGVQLSPGG